MSSTYFMIKPEAVRDQVFGEILHLVSRNRFRVDRLELRTLSRQTAEEFYAEHKERPFFADLVAYMTSGPVIAIQLSGDEAQPRLRQLVGATNPADATPGTVRYMFGSSLQENAVHASDSPDSAARELRIIFGD
jgi:nucleoside-diphosphate kinase